MKEEVLYEEAGEVGDSRRGGVAGKVMMGEIMVVVVKEEVMVEGVEW